MDTATLTIGTGVVVLLVASGWVALRGTRRLVARGRRVAMWCCLGGGVGCGLWAAWFLLASERTPGLEAIGELLIGMVLAGMSVVLWVIGAALGLGREGPPRASGPPPWSAPDA